MPGNPGAGTGADAAGGPDPSREGAARLWLEDLHRLREAHLAAQRAELTSQLAQQRLASLVLELEWQYQLLGQEALVDIHAGRIERRAQVSCSIDATGCAGLRGGLPASRALAEDDGCSAKGLWASH